MVVPLQSKPSYRKTIRPSRGMSGCSRPVLIRGDAAGVDRQILVVNLSLKFFLPQTKTPLDSTISPNGDWEGSNGIRQRNSAL